MSIAAKSLEEITGEDIAALAATPDPQHVATLEKWSKADAAIAAASLANTAGGLVIINAAVSDKDLASIAGELGPTGRFLVRAKSVTAAGKQVGVIAVAAAATPPVLVESTGAIYCRTNSGLKQVMTRAGLDELLHKEQLARERGEHNIEGMLDRVAFGHFNYMSVAVVVAPRINSDQPYRWAAANKDALLALDFAKESGFAPSHIDVSAGEIELVVSDDVTGFIRVARNGCVAAGERSHRPSQDLYLSPPALSRRLSELVAAAAAPYAATHAGAVSCALFLEGIRDLRLPVDGGATTPSSKDLVREFLPARYLEAPEEREALRLDVLRAAGRVFDADLVRGTAEAKPAPAKPVSLQPKAWHGLTKRTERRVAGLRNHGSR